MSAAEASIVDIWDRAVGALTDLGEGWRHSVFAPELELDGEEAHKTWSVELTDMDVELDPRQRIRSDDGQHAARATTRLVVRWGWMLPVDGFAAAYRAALTEELNVAVRIMQMDTSGMLTPKLRGITRTIVGDGSWMMMTARYDLIHPLASEQPP